MAADAQSILNNREAAITALQVQATTFLTDLQNAADVEFSDGFNIDDLLPDSYDYADLPILDFPQPIATRPDVAFPEQVAPVGTRTTLSALSDIVVPDFSTASPSLDYPSTPSAILPGSPGGGPSFDTPALPTAPLVNLPTVPTFASLVLPTLPSIDLPVFSAVAPDDDMLTPTAAFSYFEAPYASILLSPLQTKLLDNLLNGGYGIETVDEVALFNRARDREIEAMLSRVEDTGRIMASRGFPLPPGELNVEISRAYQAMQNKVSDNSRDITLQRNKLFVENRQFTIQEVRGIEQITIGFHNSVQERALNVSKATVEMGIAIFDAVRNRYLARIEFFRASAQVFSERIRAELVKAEIYRTQMEGARVQVEAQRQQVEVYLAQLKGIEISVDIYKAQTEAARIIAEIQRIKFDAFKAQVDAYTAQVQAKVAEFNMYRAQIEGQKLKVDLYEGQVRAFLGLVEAAKVRSTVQTDRLRAETDVARVNLAGFQEQIEAYKANLMRIVEKGKLQVDLYRADVQSAEQQTSGNFQQASLLEKSIEATQAQNNDIARIAVETAKAKLLATVEALRFKTEAVKYGSEKFFAQLTALTASVNSLAVVISPS